MLIASELAKIATEFPDDLVRMRNCLRRIGRTAPDDVLMLAWARYSDRLCASWLTLPENETTLTEILQSYLPESGVPTGEAILTTLEEAEGENRNAVLLLPLDLLDRLGWKTGDTLSLSEDSGGGFTLRRA
ncbi:hypothetical protein [Paraburkholderia sp. 40]|uniref:hypothetical protein n=1 Tax=Paraburkholderia sp. 40 TaxID=2991059 RepID=UPI003D1E33E4